MTISYVPQQLYVATQSGHVARVNNANTSGGPQTSDFVDISPSAAILSTLGTVIKLIVDPANSKKLILLGDCGIAYTDDASISPTTWQLALVNATVFYPAASTDVPGMSSIHVNTGDVVQIAATGTWCFGPGFCSGPDGLTNWIDSRALIPNALVGKLIGRIDTGSWFTIGSSSTFTATSSGTLYLIDNDVSGQFGDNTGILTVYISKNTFLTINIADITGIAGQRGHFSWLSKGTIGGTDFVFYNTTIDYWNSIQSALVARYTSSLVYSISLNSFDRTLVWVSAGDPSHSDAFVYESTNSGQSFAAVSSLLGNGGGAALIPYRAINGGNNA